MRQPSLTIPERHQFKIAKSTLLMTDAGAWIMGGMTKPEARTFLAERIGWPLTRIAKFEFPEL